MTTQKTIAVIIPVYNVAPYLRECLDSVVNQTYSHLKIIIVDDGSTDDSYAICKSYAQKDERILLIHQENGGLSVARNTGMKYIDDCDFVSFIDSDDYLELQAYEECIGYIEQHPEVDLLSFQATEFSEMNPPIIKGKFHTIHTYSREEAIREYIKPYSFKIQGSVCNKLIKSQLVRNLLFPVGRYYEDNQFCFEVLLKTNCTHILPTAYYNYRRGRTGSITTANPNRIIDLFQNIEDLLPHVDKTSQTWLNTMFINRLFFHKHLFHDTTFRKLIQPYFERAKKRPYINVLDYRSEFLHVKLFMFSPTLYFTVMKWKEKLSTSIRRLLKR
ncbi:MAG: glycosyltransferase [Prevotellaceae bacterium]|nr:glycosyltransferase [Prevotellaceae bacterium]